MRKLVLGSMLVLLAANPAHAERFAISCKGTRTISLDFGEKGPPVSSNSAKAVFIIDDEARTVHQYIKANRPLATICGVPGMVCERNFSPSRITVTGELVYQSSKRTHSFDWDRTTGRLETVYAYHLNGSLSVTRETLKCAPTALPKLPAL